MKLAYVNELPKKDQLDEFIQLYTEECITVGGTAPEDWQKITAGCIISVYDEDKLVGLGSMEDALHIHVRPTYEHRDIETTVHKLLQTTSKYSLSHG